MTSIELLIWAGTVVVISAAVVIVASFITALFAIFRKKPDNDCLCNFEDLGHSVYPYIKTLSQGKDNNKENK